jgi:putative hydrolase
MSPFGFTPDGTPDDSGKEPDFNAMMRAMQEQMKEQFEKLGINSPGFVNPFANMFAAPGVPGDVLPQATVRESAKRFVSAQGLAPLGTKDLAVVENAFEIAEIWLNEATSFPATSAASNPATWAASRSDWVDTTLAGWQRTMEPLASGLALAISSLLDEAVAGESEGDAEAGAGAPIEMITTILRAFIGTMIATQLGQSIGALATEVTGAHDVGLPLLDPAKPLIIPENIEKWSVDLEIPKSEVFIFHALRESAVARLFAHNPWLVSYMQSSIAEYGKGIHIDIEAIQRQAETAFENMQIDPNNPDLNNLDLSAMDPNNAFTLNLDAGVFTPEDSPAQKIALAKLETVLALIEGWTDEVTTLAAGDRLPSIQALRETFRRRRVASPPAEKLFKTMLGLKVSPKLTREASAFWSQVRELKSVSERDQIWGGLLPSAEDLLAPEKFLSSTTIPDDLSGLI